MIEKISDHVWHGENLCHTLFCCKLGHYLGFRLAAFLEIEICSIVQSLDNDLFKPPDDEKRGGITRLPELFEERGTIHLRHLVIGDDGIVPLGV